MPKPRKTYDWSSVSSLKDLERPWQEDREEDLRASKSKQRPTAKTENQAAYMKAMRESVVTLCNGPAGSGKTFLACSYAAELLREGKVEKLVLTRPLVTCGEGLGFLPGDKDQKITPYMRPVLDALSKFFPGNELNDLLKSGAVELWPLELMRGMSIENAVMVCDEAQNAVLSQLRMLLTRFEGETKVIVTGDVTQSDLPYGGRNSFQEVIRRLGGIGGVSIARLNRSDIIRHNLIAVIDERLSSDWSEAAKRTVCPKCMAGVWYGEDGLVVCWGCDTLIETDLNRASPAQDPRSKSLAAASFKDRRDAR